MNIAGFTGTRNGMTKKQKEAFKDIIILLEIDEFHHGDCIGADFSAHEIIKEINTNIKVIIHPPSYAKYRSFCKGNVILGQKPYLDRNKDIVDHSNLLIATPGEFKEKLRSGTWSTIRYARKKDKPIYIIMPSGKIKKENIKNE
ncbi:hypothetical protein LCGC14_2635740 [marine sediment metagenome]|uniref:DUF2493 domain-containing protein n=1 Tax=marine sediment metagenome TaxID=412755 RepID=A0A0F9ALH5_9ZZZZ